VLRESDAILRETLDIGYHVKLTNNFCNIEISVLIQGVCLASVFFVTQAYCCPIVCTPLSVLDNDQFCLVDRWAKAHSLC
jgi:hypothetical protein